MSTKVITVFYDVYSVDRHCIEHFYYFTGIASLYLETIGFNTLCLTNMFLIAVKNSTIVNEKKIY